MAIRSINDKTAIITGATSGIGLETARALSLAGANVVVAGRRVERLQAFVTETEAAGRAALAVATDVADESQVVALVAAAQERFGSVDFLVNNAGSGISAKFEDVSIEDFRRLMDVNFWGAVYGCRAVLPVMRKQTGGGHIVNVSSILGKRGMPFETAYCATKFALAGFSEALRTEVISQNIDVTTVFPGIVETEFLEASKNTIGMAMPPGMPAFQANQLAAVLIQNARFPQREIVMALDAQFINFFNTVAPGAVDLFLGMAAPFMGTTPGGRS